MPRKKRQSNSSQTDPTNEIVKKVKSLMLETIVREWLNSPCKEWGGKTPLGMIKKGEGQKILDALTSAEVELKKERNGTDTGNNSSVEESVVEEGEQTHQCFSLI